MYFWIDSEMLGGTVIRWVVLAAGILILVLWAIGPFLRWLTTDYVFTDRRIIVRSGIITRHGKDMPLAKVNNVSFFVPAMGRILNYGDLNIQSAGENDGLYITDVPDVEDIQRKVYQFIEADEQRRRGGNTDRPAAQQLHLTPVRSGWMRRARRAPGRPDRSGTAGNTHLR